MQKIVLFVNLYNINNTFVKYFLAKEISIHSSFAKNFWGFHVKIYYQNYFVMSESVVLLCVLCTFCGAIIHKSILVKENSVSWLIVQLQEFVWVSM